MSIATAAGTAAAADGTPGTHAGDRESVDHRVGADGPADAPGADAQVSGSIEQMRGEIDAIDAELLRLIRRRTDLSHAIGAARASHGGTRIVYSREMKVLERFAELGSAGTDLGMLLLSLGRGRLGRR